MWPFRWMMHRKRGLRMAIVTMLASSPKNGVELMDEIEKMTQGWWRPSPGSVYPVLEQLTKDGMTTKKEDGRYELTDKASDELESSFGPSFGRRQRSVDEMFEEVSGFVSYLEEVTKTNPDKLKERREELKKLADRLTQMSKD
ncbi:MAG: PadR family transcriptional regulator [Thaumarchaeota archaeon]|nr:PadR family transcriptional regulator [Nitrososphaerota archaeon]